MKALLPDKIDRFVASKNIPPADTYEPWTSLYIKHAILALLRTRDEDMVCLDIGANGGWYAALMARLLAEPSLRRHHHVVAIEPITPTVVEQAQRDCRDAWDIPTAGGMASMECSWCAVSDVKEPILKTVYMQGPGWVLRPNKEPGDGTYQVLFTSLDAWKKSRSLSKLHFIKMDIDGHEIKALRGMQGILASDKPVLEIEFGWPTSAVFGDDVEEGRRILHAHGYRLYSCRGESLDKGPLPIPVGSGVDVACIPPGFEFPEEVRRINKVWQEWVARGAPAEEAGK